MWLAPHPTRKLSHKLCASKSILINFCFTSYKLFQWPLFFFFLFFNSRLPTILPGLHEDSLAERLFGSDLIKCACVCARLCVRALVKSNPREPQCLPYGLNLLLYKTPQQRLPCMAVVQLAALASVCGSVCNTWILSLGWKTAHVIALTVLWGLHRQTGQTRTNCRGHSLTLRLSLKTLCKDKTQYHNATILFQLACRGGRLC